ncbi:class I SAM-dependent methyltransferase [Nostoc sp. TCL26-01]|uniref:class I SAM-dependent methyltransferase n=1 Tax=Nostoc sp. TCL26-01 TaxID=2576904 RepID=UPI0015BCAD57|nr:class I SAM-dependent methyltransferase [Nostoc sp. TCL26-01]QLE54664.1 methyltransferase domain-containing protein [Nostoc sp. TCL26-01]
MRKSNYYDNIAQIYDQTRWLTESIAEEVADFIINLTSATSKTSFLEPGIGTGLNMMPLVRRGYFVTGIDISSEMLDQFRRKFDVVPPNLQLINADASQLPFADNSFDVVLTVHMLHTVVNWRNFLDDINRVLKPGGFYLNCQWITPPARKEFEGYFRQVLSKYVSINQKPPQIDKKTPEIDVEEYLQSQGYAANYLVAKAWMVSNTVEELLSFFQARAYGLCWQVSDEVFEQVMNEFAEFCLDYYGSGKTMISSEAKFEIWSYRAI